MALVGLHLEDRTARLDQLQDKPLEPANRGEDASSRSIF
jgi:hypothetical protein